MKQIVLIFALSLVSISVYSQYPKVYGHNTFDMVGRSIHNSYDGGIYITGVEKLTLNGQLTGYVLKTDINGNQLWKRYVGNQDFITNVLGLSQLNDGSILITGETSEYYDGVGFAMKVDRCGSKIWCKVFSTNGRSSITENVTLPDGSSTSLACHMKYSYDRVWLYHLNSDGELIWEKCMEPDTSYFNETGYNLIITNDSCLLLCGFNYFIREPGSELGWYSPMWVKFDLDGNQIWDLTWNGNGFIHGNFGRTVQDAKGYYYGAGSDGFQEVGMKACFFKFTPDGVPFSNPCIYHNGIGSLTKSINFFQDSTLFLGGSYSISTTIGSSMVIKCDTVGSVIRTMDVPLWGAPVLYSTLTSDNKIIALGERYDNSLNHWETCLFKFNQNLEYDSTYTQQFTYDSLCAHAVAPNETIPLDCVIVDTEEPIKKPEGCLLRVFPLPSTDLVTLALPEYYVIENQSHHIKTTTTYYQLKGDKTIEIFNLSGKSVAVLPLPDGQTIIKLDISAWAPGMYLARLVCRDKVWAQGKIMVAR